MPMGNFDAHGRPVPMAEINVVPLVDVMLVLLVIFIVTAPLLTHALKIDLPRARSAPTLGHTARVELGIRADGALYWNGEAIVAEQLPTRFANAAKKQPQPELHIRADRLAHYGTVADVMAGAAAAGLARIGFVTDPIQR
jgi:biopolymer transport protein ExbD